jgi:hypothetical protein
MLLAVTAIAACGRSESSDPTTSYSAPSYSPPPGPVRIIDEMQTLPEGGGMTWKIPPGTYTLRVVASPDGASVSWTGASCKGTGEVKEFNSDCVVRQDAQLTVKNPTTLGTGPSVNATVILTRDP